MNSTYELRFLNSEGTLSLLMRVDCVDDDGARREAVKMFSSEFAEFQILRDGDCVESEKHLGAAA
jgi:hypothetical protein